MNKINLKLDYSNKTISKAHAFAQQQLTLTAVNFNMALLNNIFGTERQNARENNFQKHKLTLKIGLNIIKI